MNPRKFQREWILLQTTSANRQRLQDMARELIAERLVACAQLSGPIESHYQWQGEMEQAEEFQLTLKTAADLFEEVSAAISRRHDYEVPEMIALPITACSIAYRDWMESQVKLAKPAKEPGSE